MTTISNLDDIIDVRDIIERIETLENEKDDFEHDDDGNLNQSDWSSDNADEATELNDLTSVMEEIKGYGGDEEWRGDWYPITLIRDSYFKDYAQELAEDIGAIKSDATWPNNCIDWEQAARELQQDYTSVSFSGTDYWCR